MLHRTRAIAHSNQVQPRRRPAVQLLKRPPDKCLVYAQRRASRYIRRTQRDDMDHRRRLCVSPAPSIQPAKFSPRLSSLAESRFLVSGSADNSMKLWDVQTGKCLFTWEFPTAVKRVAFSEDDTLIACITEQRMGYSGAIRIFEINRSGRGTDRMCQTSWFSWRKTDAFFLF